MTVVNIVNVDPYPVMKSLYSAITYALICSVHFVATNRPFVVFQVLTITYMVNRKGASRLALASVPAHMSKTWAWCILSYVCDFRFLSSARALHVKHNFYTHRR